MGNKITAKYFTYTGFSEPEIILAEIGAKTNFLPEREIFRGQIYDKSKVGSLIYKGRWKNNLAVLKIQVLRPEIDEIDIIARFNRQNMSTKIRLPVLYDGKKWHKKIGYGYLLSEYIDAPKIYQPPFASRKQMRDFCWVYQEYKSRCLNKPLFKKEPDERTSLIFLKQRLAHWLKIAKSKGPIKESTRVIVRKYQLLVERQAHSCAMVFMHGHFTYDDIYKTPGGKYVLMSNLFWSYRPEYYDAVFHLWAGIKSIRDGKIVLRKITNYLDQWITEYKKLPAIKTDHDFEKKFYLMMSERCVGALLVDLNNQHYVSDRKKHIVHLTTMFRSLFAYCVEKSDNTK